MDKPIPKDIPPTEEQKMDSIFDATPLPAWNQRRINVLRSCADWLENMSTANLFIRYFSQRTELAQRYAKDLREIADFIEKCQNEK